MSLPYLPYTYLVGWSPEQTGRDYWTYYYGCKYAVGCHPDLFWVDYFTSSDEVANKRKEWGDPAFREIRKTFHKLSPGREAGDIVTAYEKRVLTKLDVMHRVDFLNGSNGGGLLSTIGMVVAKTIDGEVILVPQEVFNSSNDLQGSMKDTFVVDLNGEKFRISKDDTRLLNGELASMHKGLVMVKDNDGKFFKIPMPEYDKNSTQYQAATKGKTPMFNIETSHMEHVDVDDPRIGTILQHHNTGRQHVQCACSYCGKHYAINSIKSHERCCSENPNRQKNNTAPRKTCPHCGKFSTQNHINCCHANPNRREGTQKGKTWRKKVEFKHCSYCGITMSASNIDRHEKHCSCNPNRIPYKSTKKEKQVQRELTMINSR